MSILSCCGFSLSWSEDSCSALKAVQFTAATGRPPPSRYVREGASSSSCPWAIRSCHLPSAICILRKGAQRVYLSREYYLCPIHGMDGICIVPAPSHPIPTHYPNLSVPCPPNAIFSCRMRHAGIFSSLPSLPSSLPHKITHRWPLSLFRSRRMA